MTEHRISFPSDDAAEAALIESGFSIGRNQRSDPRGIMYGDYDIAKWRSLSASDKKCLHGVFQRHGPPGAHTTVTLRVAGETLALALEKVKTAAASLSAASQGDAPAGQRALPVEGR